MDENFAQTSGVDGMRGMAATRAIRAFSLPDLVIIGCTGDSSETHDAMAVEAGQDAVLGKPVSMESVEAVVRAHLTRLPSRLRVVVAAGRSADRFALRRLLERLPGGVACAVEECATAEAAVAHVVARVRGAGEPVDILFIIDEVFDVGQVDADGRQEELAGGGDGSGAGGRMTGTAAARAIRESYDSTGLVIVGVTATPSVMDGMARAARQNAVIKKPVQMTELLALLRTFFC